MTVKPIKIIFIGIIGLLALAVVALQFYQKSSPRRAGNDQEYLTLLKQVMGIVKKSYVEPVDEKKLLKGAINGMLASLDPHSVYMAADSFKEMQISTTGAFGGLGIEITIKEGKLTVISPIEDTPAFRAGVKSGDHIALIDGAPTQDMTINDAVKRMRGPKDTRVTLTVLRKGTDKPFVFPLVRDIIQVKSLRFRTLSPGYGYLRIMQFQSRTGVDLAAALESLKKENGGTLQGLVLDLRNNPGGLLDQAVSVANHFIGDRADNALIVYTRGREESSRQDFMASIGEKEPLYPIVLLINGGSASASEIIAGCLQDHGRAVIMGTQSFGKGSVQSIMGLPNNAGLLLTTAKYYTPKGRSIQAKGISPDIVVENLLLNGKSKPESAPFREKDLDNHITDGAGKPSGPLPQTIPTQAVQPDGGTRIPVDDLHLPAKSLADDQMKQDYQLLRAFDLLKGLNLLKKAAMNN
jgi:carboxyl-terminal processing protease